MSIPKGIWALGFVSLFMDISSELVHSLLPVFMVSVLGASMVSVGIIEGVAEAAASISKFFSGTLSDVLGKRKNLTVLGYSLAALTKPLFALAPTVGWVFAARFTDRIGKGIRGAPRDAMIADITPVEVRGAGYGLRQSLDTIGAFLGPLSAILLMALLANDIRAVLWFALVPAMISVAILIVVVEEPERRRAKITAHSPFRLSTLGEMDRAYWWVVAIGGFLTLARFSEAFLILRAENVGLSITYVPVIMVIMSIVYALSAYPAGALSDRMDRRLLLAVGSVVLMAADIVLALASTVWMVFIGAAFWGLHMGLTQGLLAALVADTSPDELRGTAFGLFNAVSGVLLIAASVLAGILWDIFNAPVTFFTGAVFAAMALLGFVIDMQRRAKRIEVSGR